MFECFMFFPQDVLSSGTIEVPASESVGWCVFSVKDNLDLEASLDTLFYP